jgi:hypothetical protein
MKQMPYTPPMPRRRASGVPAWDSRAPRDVGFMPTRRSRMVRSLLLAILAVLLISVPAFARGKRSGGGPKYAGAKHGESHSGKYRGGKGSSHKGGKYTNPRFGNGYGRHKR